MSAILYLLPFILIISIPLSSTSFQEKNVFLECLVSNDQFENSSSISQVIYTQENSSYNAIFISTVRNLSPYSCFPLRPILILTPIYESQIQTAVYCSKKTGIQIRVRSGGHDFEGLSYISQNTFVIVDMRNFRSISIDTETNTSWIQTGSTLGDVYYAIAEKSRSLAFPAGSCHTVGVGGHFSGGGYGMLSRKYGMAIDNIIDAKIVNANGQILDRKSMGEDLFWAIRGGGAASFGIVLSFKVKLVAIPEIVTVFNVRRTYEQKLIQLVHRWQYVADKMDENLMLRLSICRSVTSGNGNTTTTGAEFRTLFVGRADDLLLIMQDQFPELGLLKKDCIELSWIESMLLFAGFPRNTSLDALKTKVPLFHGSFKTKSDFVRQPIPEEIIRGLLKFIDQDPSLSLELEISPYGGKLNEFSETEVPFPYRAGNIFMIEYSVTWENPGEEESERHRKFSRKVYDYMEPYVSQSPRAAYLNYRDLDIGMNHQRNTSYEQASVWGSKYFKNNFRRLARVKTMVDPTNFFRNEQSIPVMSPSEMEEKFVSLETPIRNSEGNWIQAA